MVTIIIYVHSGSSGLLLVVKIYQNKSSLWMRNPAVILKFKMLMDGVRKTVGLTVNSMMR